MKKIILILVLVIFIIGCAEEKTEVPSAKEAVPEEMIKKEVAAVVNDVEITKDEIVQKLTVYIRSNEAQIKKSGMWQKANETEAELVQRLMPLMGKGILEQMIIEILIEQKAEEQKVTVRPEEIDDKIDEIKKQSAGEEIFMQELSKIGMTIEELRQQAESQILMEKLVAKEVTVTEEDIKNHFERYKANFAKPEEVRASHILLRTEEEAKGVLSQLKAGADFAELAKEKSTDPGTKDKGGELGFFSRGRMTPAFEKAAFALEAGGISEVVATPYGYHIIKLEEKKPAQEPNLELLREEIKNTLTQQKTWTKRSTFLQDLKGEAKIEIRLPGLRD